MLEMKKIPYKIELNIFQVPNRHCRHYQEKIFDYYDNGRARFEWEWIKQQFVLKKDFTIENICQNCPINILLDVEGCKGDLYEFEVFLRMLSNVKPDAMLLQKNLLNCRFDEEETRQLIEEMETIQQQCSEVPWPVAQVFVDSEPLISDDSFRPDQLVYYEWSGDDDQIFFSTNPGYHVGTTNEGLILKKNFGETIPEVFASLSRKGMRVVGMTSEGKMMPIPINRAALPEWWPENPTGESELRFTNIPASDIFADVFNMIIVFGEFSLKHLAGVSIFSEFYRRA